MAVCKYCSRLDFVKMETWEPPAKSSFDRDEFLFPRIEHHHNMEELLECGFAATGRCKLCEIFVVSWIIWPEWENHTAASSWKEQPLAVRARNYLEMVPDICQRRLYAGPFRFKTSLGMNPGIALWIMEGDDEDVGNIRVAEAMFSWKKRRSSCSVFSFTG